MRLAAYVTLTWLVGCWAYGRGHQAGKHRTEIDFANHLAVIGA